MVYSLFFFNHFNDLFVAHFFIEESNDIKIVNLISSNSHKAMTKNKEIGRKKGSKTKKENVLINKKKIPRIYPGNVL